MINSVKDNPNNHLGLLYFVAMLQETMCSGFEKTVLSGYEDPTSRGIIGSDAYITDMKEKVARIKETGQTEPMEYLHAWIKLESREIEVSSEEMIQADVIQAFLEAIAQREKYIALQHKAEEKQRSAENTLDRVSRGKATLKTMFSKRGQDEEVDILEKEIAKVSEVLKFLKSLYSIKKKLNYLR